MSQLGTIWRREWTALVERLPAVGALSSCVGEVKGKRQYLPSKAVQQRAFPTVFARSLPQPDDNWLRDYPVDSGRDDITSDQEDRLILAMKEAGPWLARLGGLVPRVDPLITARDLGVTSKRDGVLAICLPVTEHGPEVTDAEVVEFVDGHKAVTVGASPDALRKALRKDDRVKAVEDELRDVGMPGSQRGSHDSTGDTGDTGDSERPLREFLNAPGLKELGTPASLLAGRSDPVADAAWDAAKSSGVDAWHWRARQIHLSAHEVPPLPPVKSQGRLPTFEPVLWLDTSICDRLAPALNFDLKLRQGLPPLQDFIDLEVERATSPLGLSDTASRTLVALGGVIQREYIDDYVRRRLEADDRKRGFIHAPDERTNATEALMRSVAAWRKVKTAFDTNASFPGQALDNIIDLPRWYMSTLWRRVHTHEVQGGVVSSPGGVWWLLTQLGKTAAHNIRAKKWPTAVLAGEDGPPEISAPEPEPEPDSVEPGALVDVLLTTLGVDRAEFAKFLKGDWGTDAHRETWQRWCDEAGVDLSYEDLWRWWEENRPE